MATNATGEAESGPLRLQFDRTVKLASHGSAISSDGGLLLHRELDDALGLTDAAANLIADPRTGNNGRHRLAGFLRQSIFLRLAGYEEPTIPHFAGLAYADGRAARAFFRLIGTLRVGTVNEGKPNGESRLE